MSEVKMWKCDGCGVLEQRPRPPTLPTGWVRVMKFNCHLCSACLVVLREVEDSIPSQWTVFQERVTRRKNDE